MKKQKNHFKLMFPILDNPIWNALITGNKKFAYGTDRAKCLKRDVGFFAGLKDNTVSDLVDLEILVFEGDKIILFIPGEIPVPPSWEIEVKKELLQMIYLQPSPPFINDKELIPLQEKDIPAMLDLTARTNPGPFLHRTIDFGNYEGIFQDNNLVAMAGQRLQPEPYVEISAVCTHPDHLGKGYAARLICNQIRRIMAASQVPFLHLFSDNLAAYKLYEKLGFITRKQMLVYVLRKKVVEPE